MSTSAQIEALERLALQDLDEIDYARLGWFTQPILGRKFVTDSTGHALRPTRTESEIHRRWQMNPEVGVSLALAESKLISIDVDAHRGGNETFVSLSAGGTLPPHPACSTPRGGRHLLFRQPVCSVIQGKTDGLGQGVDVLTNRCIVPPTPGYFWLNSPRDVEVPYLPYWLWKLLPKMPEVPRQRSAGGRHFRFRLDDVLPRLKRVRGSSARGYTCCCPVKAHDDDEPSFSITTGDDGEPLFYCFRECPADAIIAALEQLAGVA